MKPQLLVRQGFVVPLGAMLVAILTGLLLPGYSSVSAHISEMTVLDHPAALLTRACAGLTGVSLLLFSLGLLLSTHSRFAFTAFASALGGTAMLFNGVFIMGHPLHGLYGLAFFIALVPAFFAAELGRDHGVRALSLAASLLILGYFWLQVTGFDPQGFRGLTQRIAIIIMFGWYVVAGRGLLSAGVVQRRQSEVATEAA